ncbi:MAG: hypothetical protein H6733_15575 [Alphaproteobacteria bacterium]|nr:hypothetical protein [Alphaproteobacteria bacterium]
MRWTSTGRILTGWSLGGALLFGALAASTPALADDDSATVACVRNKVWEAYDGGWGLRTITHDTAVVGERLTWKVTLYANRTYRFLSCAQDGAEDVDLVLFDSNGHVVKSSSEGGRAPTLEISGAELGAYYIVAYLRKADAPKAPREIAVAITHK